MLQNPTVDTATYKVVLNNNKGIAKYYVRIKEQYQTVNKFYELSIKFAKRIGDMRNLAYQYYQLGISYELMGDYELATKHGLKAISFYLAINDSTYAAHVYLEMGNIYRNWGRESLAEENYRTSLDISANVKDSLCMSGAYIGIGNILNEQGKYKEALEYFTKSYDIEKKIKSIDGLILAFISIAEANTNIGDNTKALEYSSKALELCRNESQRFRTATVLNLIGDIYINLHKFKKAETYLKEALTLARELNFKQAEQDALEFLSGLYAAKQEYKKAYDYSRLYHSTKDSIFNAEKFKELSTLEIKYKTAEKDKKILLQNKEIETGNLKLQQERLIRNIFIVGVSIALLFSIYILVLYRQKQKANKLLAKQKDEIEEQRDDIQNQKLIIEKIHRQVSESIDYATRLQQSILPDPNILKANFNDFFVLFKPKDKVSGDFYWWHATADNTLITAADCTGHGVPGAFMSVLGVTFLREIIIKNGILQPNLVLKQLRNEIVNALDQKGKLGEQKDGMDMALVNINHKTKVLQFSGAYNPLYIVRSNENLKLEGVDKKQINPIYKQNNTVLFELKGNKMPIGIYQKMTDFDLYEVKLQTGDRLFMFSDGFADQFGGPKGKKLKYKSFRRLILSSSHLVMKEQMNVLEQAFLEWKGNIAQIDDVVVLGVEIN